MTSIASWEAYYDRQQDAAIEAPAFERYKRHVATRKPTVCADCHQTISIGRPYYHCVSMFDGTFVAENLCAVCYGHNHLGWEAED
jgi:hypothetical protein